MQLAPGSAALVESFLRRHLDDPGLVLPRVHFHAPRLAVLLHRADVLALTVGRHVVLSPVVVGRDEQGAVRLPARLVVHECLHVMQYRVGLARFLYRYLRHYLRGLRAHGLMRPARNRAYRDIPFESEARAAERAWAALDDAPTWLHAAHAPRERQQPPPPSGRISATRVPGGRGAGGGHPDRAQRPDQPEVTEM
jgi:hypothetical protein